MPEPANPFRFLTAAGQRAIAEQLAEWVAGVHGWDIPERVIVERTPRGMLRERFVHGVRVEEHRIDRDKYHRRHGETS